MDDATRDFQLAQIEVYPDQSKIVTPEGERHVEPKVMAVLQCLAKHPQQVVSRTELLENVWTGTVVTDEVVTRCISELRNALGDSTKSPRFIQTIPKKGYKLLQRPTPLGVNTTTQQPWPQNWPRGWAIAGLFVATVFAGGLLYFGLPGFNTAVTKAATTQLSELPTPANPAVAIMPFVTLSAPDGVAESTMEVDYFGAGLAEELLNALVNVPGLRVASRSAALKAEHLTDLMEIATTLGVDAVLTGTVRRSGERVRVTAQLVNGTDGFHLWADQFDGSLTDVFSIQDEIAAAIVDALRLQLTEPVQVARISTDMDALDYYLLGRHHWHQRTPASLQRAIDLFKQAVDVDPKIAIAYSGLADGYLLLADYGDLAQSEAIRLARPAIETALKLDPKLAEAHASLGMLHLSEGDSQAAETAFLTAVRLNPAYPMGLMWLGSAVAMQGRVKEAHDYYIKAYRLDPMHPVINNNVAMSFATLGDYPLAYRVLDKIDSNSDDRNWILALKLSLAEQLGDFEKVTNLAQQLLADSSSDDSAEKNRQRAYAALWHMYSRKAEAASAAKYLELAQTEGKLGYKFNMLLAKNYARHGEAEAFNAIVEDAAELYEDKVVMYRRSLEGLLYIVSERYTEAVSVLESAMTKTPHKQHPAAELFAVSHLMHAYDHLGNDDRRDYWRGRGEAIIDAAQRNGYGQFGYVTEVAFFYGAAGNAGRAAEAFWQALALGKLAPWELTEDTRLYGVLKSDALKPLLAEAARTWPA